MSLTNTKDVSSQKGFTIVELLIVVVIIGILAAIVLVAYNGLTNRARLASSQETASTLAKKAESYNAENGSYPQTFAALSGAAATTSYFVDAGSVDFKATTNVTVQNAAGTTTGAGKTFNWATCVTPTGIRIQTWDFVNSAVIKTYLGGATAASTCTNTAT